MANYMSINPADFANGEGVRISLFFSGCSLRCDGCFNKEAWNFNAGKEFNNDTIDMILELLKQEHIRGLSILGGEPFDQDDNFTSLCRRTKELNNKDIWVWTGHMFEKIRNHPAMEYIDTIIDGRFEQDKAALNLKFRGSSNQRLWKKENGIWRVIDN